MAAEYKGSVTVGGLMPGALSAALAGQAGIQANLPSLQAELSGLLSLQITPPSLQADIDVALGIVTSLQANLALGLEAPSASIAVAAQIGILTGLIASIEAQLTIVVEFIGILAQAGVHVYRYSGDVSSMATELGASISTNPPGVGNAEAWLVVATAGATVGALERVLI